MDLITLEVIQQFLTATVREMRATMIRTAHSSVITEGFDFSCAILDADAQLLAQSESSPAHIIPLPSQVQEAKVYFEGNINSGDVILVNDPYTSGTHLNDVAMIVPFYDEDVLIAYIATRAHWNDIGGMYPGSISGRATEIFQEGLRIPFVKVHQRGIAVEGLLSLILANVRSRENSAGDFHAMLSCCHAGEVRMGELISRYGPDILRAGMSALLDRSEQRMRAAIARIPNGTYYFEDYLDSDNVSIYPVPLRIAISVQGDEVTVDFSGSAQQVQGPVNCSLAVTAAGTFIALKALLDPNGYINHGSFRPARVTAPLGTVTNAVYPAAVGGFSEMRRRIESVVIGALAAAAPANVAGDHKGASNHTYIESEDPSGVHRTIFYEYPAGGTGGFLQHDGSDAVRAWDEGDFGSIQPVEVVENEHRLLVEYSELRTGSGGAGQHRGGLGLRRAVSQMGGRGAFSELSDRNILQPYGVYSGYSGAPNRFVVLRDGEEIEPSPIPGKVSGFPLRYRDAVLMESAGGGGYGDPLERPIESIVGDVRQGYIDRSHALICYGVVMKDDFDVDREATRRERALLLNQRVWLTVGELDNDDFDNGRRCCVINPASLPSINVSAAEPIELVSAGGAPLRTWLKESESVAFDTLLIGPIGRTILRIASGDRIHVRRMQQGQRGTGSRAQYALVERQKDRCWTNPQTADPSLTNFSDSIETAG